MMIWINLTRIDVVVVYVCVCVCFRIGMETEPVLRALRAKTYDATENEAAGGASDDDDDEEDGKKKVREESGDGIPLATLLQCGAASEAEVLVFLRASDAAIDMLDGSWMGIELDAVRRGLDLVMLCCEELGLEHVTTHHVIDETALLGAMREAEHGPAITMHVLRKFCETDGNGRWRVERSKVALFRAVCILDETALMPMGDFMAAWREACTGLGFADARGDGDTRAEAVAATTSETLSFTMLRGEALASSTGSVRRVRACELPLDAGARFEALFSIRSSWAWEDLAAYIESVAEHMKTTTDTLLLKFARKVNDGAEERFVAR